MRLQNTLVALAAAAAGAVTPALAFPIGELVTNLVQSASGKPVTLSIGQKLYTPRPTPPPGFGKVLAAVPENLTEILGGEGFNSQFTVNISIGTPPQEIELLLDSGSSEIVVLTTLCNACTSNNHAVLDYNKSSTYHSDHVPASINYSTGGGNGWAVQDMVTLGPSTLNFTWVNIQDTLLWYYLPQNIAGIFGMSWVWPTTNTSLSQTLAETVWPEKRFSVYLKHSNEDTDASGGSSDAGELTLGGVDPSRFTGDLNTLPLVTTTPQHWAVPLDGITVNGQAITFNASMGTTTLIDSGNEGNRVPQAVCDQIRPLINGTYEHGAMSVPCNSTFQTSYTFNGVSYDVDVADMIAPPYYGICFTRWSCRDPGPNTPYTFVAGAPFMRSAYSVFSYDPPSVAFGTLPGSSGAGSAPSAQSSASDTTTDTNTAAAASTPTPRVA